MLLVIIALRDGRSTPIHLLKALRDVLLDPVAHQPVRAAKTAVAVPPPAAPPLLPEVSPLDAWAAHVLGTASGNVMPFAPRAMG
jgi:hypothetical protein